MKDLLEPFLYPHNLVLYGLVLACICYRKKGLWLLLLFYYLAGNTFIANQVRGWYLQATTQSVASNQANTTAQYIVLGCGGSAEQLPACASARLQHLLQELPDAEPAVSPNIIITTRYCQPYQDYLQARRADISVDCYHAGDNTYQEFSSLVSRVKQNATLRFITSDYHSWRVSQLIAYHKLTATVGAASTQTFRAVNCNLNCLLTVNLTNFDFYSKLIAELSSYIVFRLAGPKITGVASE